MASFRYSVDIQANETRIRSLQSTVDRLTDTLDRIRPSSTSATDALNRVTRTSATVQAAMDRASASTRNFERVQRQLGGANSTVTRQFASIARGTDGLVRSYAIVAASVFSVVTAFQQLEQADRTRVVLEGLSGASGILGVSLNGLTDSLRRVTQGAVSLSEASRLGAFAGAGGFSPENFERLSAAALGASQTLGVNLTDAVNRLTRGIIKGEVELLDEVGIITRLDSLYERYATTLGVAARELTDYQRQQAVQIGVLELAEERFGGVEEAANRTVPAIQRIGAAVSDATLGVLTFINTGLNPIISSFLDFPALLGVVGTAFAASLVGRLSASSNAAATLQVSITALSGVLAEVDGRVRLTANTTREYADQNSRATEQARALNGILETTSNAYRRNGVLLSENIARIQANREAVSSLNRANTLLAGRINSLIGSHTNNNGALAIARASHAANAAEVARLTLANTRLQRVQGRLTTAINNGAAATVTLTARLEVLDAQVIANNAAAAALVGTQQRLATASARVTLATEVATLAQANLTSSQDITLSTAGRLIAVYRNTSNTITRLAAAYRDASNQVNAFQRASLLATTALSTVRAVGSGVSAGFSAITGAVFGVVGVLFTVTALFDILTSSISNNTQETERAEQAWKSLGTITDDTTQIVEGANAAITDVASFPAYLRALGSTSQALANVAIAAAEAVEATQNQIESAGFLQRLLGIGVPGQQDVQATLRSTLSTLADEIDTFATTAGDSPALRNLQERLEFLQTAQTTITREGEGNLEGITITTTTDNIITPEEVQNIARELAALQNSVVQTAQSSAGSIEQIGTTILEVFPEVQDNFQSLINEVSNLRTQYGNFQTDLQRDNLVATTGRITGIFINAGEDAEDYFDRIIRGYEAAQDAQNDFAESLVSITNALGVTGSVNSLAAAQVASAVKLAELSERRLDAIREYGAVLNSTTLSTTALARIEVARVQADARSQRASLVASREILENNREITIETARGENQDAARVAQLQEQNEIIQQNLLRRLQEIELTRSLTEEEVRLKDAISARRDAADAPPTTVAGGFAQAFGFNQPSIVAPPRDPNLTEEESGAADERDLTAGTEALQGALASLEAQNPEFSGILSGLNSLSSAAATVAASFDSAGNSTLNLQQSAAVGAQALSGIANIVSSSFAISNRAIQGQISFLQQYGDDSEETQQQIQKLEEERVENERKSTLASIVAQTALGVATALGQGGIYAIPFAIGIAALGALQLAAAQSAYSGGTPSIPSASAGPSLVEVGQGDNSPFVDVSQSASGVERASLTSDSFGNTQGSAISFRQTGGDVSEGQPVTVGERGVETFVPDTDGTVVSNSDRQAGTFAPNISFSVNAVDAASFSDFARQGEIRQVLARALEEEANVYGRSIAPEFNL